MKKDGGKLKVVRGGKGDYMLPSIVRVADGDFVIFILDLGLGKNLSKFE